MSVVFLKQKMVKLLAKVPWFSKYYGLVFKVLLEVYGHKLDITVLNLTHIALFLNSTLFTALEYS